MAPPPIMTHLIFWKMLISSAFSNVLDTCIGVIAAKSGMLMSPASGWADGSTLISSISATMERTTIIFPAM